MVISRIKIENFCEIDSFESPLSPRFNVFKGEHAQTIIKAIGLLLKNTSILSTAKTTGAGIKTHIEAEIELCGITRLVSARGLSQIDSFDYEIKEGVAQRTFNWCDCIHSNPEEDTLNLFCLSCKNNFSERFRYYKDIQAFYPNGEFARLTSGIGETQTFRACLREYIGQYRPERIVSDKNYHLQISDDGKFLAINPQYPAGTVRLNDFENMMFEYLCFLNINSFWQSIEDIRNINHEMLPLLIEGKVRSANEYSNLISNLKRATRLKRQIIVGIQILPDSFISSADRHFMI